MNILVLGGGGREHAIAWALAKSPRTDSLYVAPGNGGTDGIAQNVPDLNPEDGQAVLAFVRENAIDFVVIGPEAPLVAGVADVLRAAGVPTFGPDAQGAQLEGSKTFSKKFMDANDIPTARYASFTDLEPALAYVRELGAPIVVKADGLMQRIERMLRHEGGRVFLRDENRQLTRRRLWRQVNALAARLRAAGVQPSWGPGQTPCG